jgi:hypothetical protein
VNSNIFPLTTGSLKTVLLLKFSNECRAELNLDFITLTKLDEEKISYNSHYATPPVVSSSSLAHPINLHIIFFSNTVQSHKALETKTPCDRVQSWLICVLFNY